MTTNKPAVAKQPVAEETASTRRESESARKTKKSDHEAPPSDGSVPVDTESLKLHTPKPIPLHAQLSQLHVQSAVCYGSRYNMFPLCRSCIAKKVGDPCRFIRFRAFLLDEDGQFQYGPYFVGKEEVEGLMAEGLKAMSTKTGNSTQCDTPPRESAEHGHESKLTVSFALCIRGFGTP
jgi:hypothetical protein